MIFHSYVNLPEGTTVVFSHQWYHAQCQKHHEGLLNLFRFAQQKIFHGVLLVQASATNGTRSNKKDSLRSLWGGPWNGSTPKSSIFNRIFNYKPSSYWGIHMYGNPHMFSMHHFSSATLLGEDIFGEKPEPAQAKSTSIWTGVPENHGGLMGEYKATSSRVKATKPKHEWSNMVEMNTKLRGLIGTPLGEWQTHGHAKRQEQPLLPGHLPPSFPLAFPVSCRGPAVGKRWESPRKFHRSRVESWRILQFLCCFGFLKKKTLEIFRWIRLENLRKGRLRVDNTPRIGGWSRKKRGSAGRDELLRLAS